MPLSVQVATPFNFQQAHSKHGTALRCLLSLFNFNSGMPHETKNAYVSL